MGLGQVRPLGHGGTVVKLGLTRESREGFTEMVSWELSFLRCL